MNDTANTKLPPVVDAVAARAQARCRGGRVPPGARELILVIDDDAMYAECVRRLLERRGYDVIVAHDGAEALATAARPGQPIGVALVDFAMPDICGRELGPRLEELGLRGRLIFVSGAVPEWMASGQARVLYKPFSPEELVAHIRAVIAEGHPS